MTNRERPFAARSSRSTPSSEGDRTAGRVRFSDQDAASEHSSLIPISSLSGRGPRGYQRGAEAIHEEVCENLTYDYHVDASDIDVLVQDGEVTLSGSVADRNQKRRAEDIAERVRGVHDVHNRLRVTSVAQETD